MNDVTKILQESFNALKPLLMVPIAFISLSFAFRLFVIIIDDSLYTPLDFLSELKERIFYREKFTCRMDAEKCAVFEDESEIDIGELSAVNTVNITANALIVCFSIMRKINTYAENATIDKNAEN